VDDAGRPIWLIEGLAVNITPIPAGRPLSFRWPKEAPLPASAGVRSLPLIKSDGRLSTREA
jgi:hypothetical protein